MNKELLKKSKKKITLISLILFIFYLLFSGIFFLIHPTSIFSEASDINHDQRDNRIMEISRDGNNSFSTTTQGLIRTLDEYRMFWDQADLSTVNMPESTDIISSNPTSGSINNNEFKLIAQIIAFESGDNYEGALAVASCVINRIIEGGYIYEWEGLKRLEKLEVKEDDPLAVLTSKNQFEAYIENYYQEYQSGIPNQVEKAILDCFVKGKRNHNYTSFRNYEEPQSEKIGGNYFFNPISKEVREVYFNISTQNEESFVFDNKDPNGLGNWDLLYLICAYDASKNNLEGEVDNNSSRYSDLLYGVGEYIIKAAFGTTIEVKENVIKVVDCPVFEEVSVFVYENGQVAHKKFYKQTGSIKSEEAQTFPEYKQVSIQVIDNFTGDTNNLGAVTEKSDEILINGQLYKLQLRNDLYEMTDNIIEFIPEVEEVTKEKRVIRLQKSVLLDVLGLNPNDPYKVHQQSGPNILTNADYIEMCRENLIRTLNLNASDYTFEQRGSNGFIDSEEGSEMGWIWPLDPNGQGSFIITSLMGNRESPGGIGSTDHGGTDIGAVYGVAILAVEDGRVEIADKYGGYGNCVKINHGKLRDGNLYQTLYGHMSKIAVRSGSTVKKGDIIGYVGSTGWSTGPHLHFEVIKNSKKVNGLGMYNKKILDKLSFQL